MSEFPDEEETTAVIELRSEEIRKAAVDSVDLRVEELCRKYLPE